MHCAWPIFAEYKMLYCTFFSDSRTIQDHVTLLQLVQTDVRALQYGTKNRACVLASWQLSCSAWLVMKVQTLETHSYCWYII